jgi:hypothetical protein
MSLCKSQHGLLYPLRLGDEVNFRLTYDGPLKAASQSDTRRIDKHAMRCAFDRQLTELIDNRDVLYEEFTQEKIGPLVNAYRHGKFLFLPIVRSDLHLVCDLDILFLRRENPGSLVSGGGDLDNRLKVLFDALRVPQDDNEVRGLVPHDGQSLLVCLTEDDRLITGFRCTTDRLLEPANSEAEENHVRLIINVEVKATKLTTENMGYFSHF